MAISQNFPSVRPTLDLNFAATKRLDPRITFSRGSVGTYHDSTGTIQIAAPHVARFDHNPATGESLGLLVEEARTNLRIYSSAPNASNSYRIYGNATYNAAVVAPDGTATATLITGNGSSSGFDNYPNDYGSNGGAVQTYSFYVRNVNATSLQISMGGYGNPTYTFTFATETGVANAAASGSGFQKLSNGWYRIWLTGTKSNQFWYQQAYIDNGSATSASMYFWGIQLESAASFPTSYIPTPATFTGRASTATFYNSSGIIQTAAAGVARSAAFFPDSNGVFRPAGLLLEAAGTNLARYSEALGSWTNNGGGIAITSNVEVAPDGTTTADRLAQSAVTNAGRHLFNGGSSVRSGQTFTTSFWIRRVSGTDAQPTIRVYGIGGGPSQIVTATSSWQRITWTWTALNDGGNYEIGSVGFSWDINGAANNNVYSIWGFQVEQNPYATSYIPTAASTVTRAADTSTSATVTRSADVATMTGTNFSSWFNQNEGTVFADTTDIGYPVNYGGALWKIFASTSHVSGRNSIGLNRSSGGALPEARFGIIDQNATTQVDLNTATSPTKARVKSAIALKSASYAATSHGNAVVTSSVAIPPTFVAADTLAFGQATNTTIQSKSCLISRLTYWPTRLANATLQSITAS